MEILVRFREAEESAIVTNVGSWNWNRLENGEILFEVFDAPDDRIISAYPMSAVRNIDWNYDD